jgi:protein MpaA
MFNISLIFKMKHKHVKILTGCLLTVVLTLAGCFEPVDYPQITTTSPSQSILNSPQQRIAGYSVKGRPIVYLTLGYGPETILIMATIHGNEPAGTPLVRRLNTYLQNNPDMLAGRTVILMPVANPDGLELKSRYNANKVDLNRNFAAENRVNNKENGPAGLSEPESQAIEQIIRQHTPDRIVSLHQMVGQNYDDLAQKFPAGCIDYDGPGERLANHMAEYCELPVKKLGSRPGSLGSYAGITLGIPIITFEMKRNDTQLDSQTLWDKYRKALLAAITYPETPESRKY